MNKSPTDLKILKTIFDTYYAEFIRHTKAGSPKNPWNYLSIDIEFVAKSINMDPDLLFGRLFFYLDEKYRYKQDNKKEVKFFRKEEEGHYINFVMLEGILANMKSRHFRFWLPMILSIFAILISGLGILLN